MAWYRQGSVSIEAGSNVVIGTGTKWTVNLYGIGEGQALVVNGERLEIMYVDSDTKIRLALPHEAGYTGNYHIETSYAGTGGDASRQIMAAIRRLTTLSFDWTEWMTSDAATITATDVLGQPVEIATYKSLTALAGDIDAFKALLALDGYTVKDKDGKDVKIDSLQLIQQRVNNLNDRVHSYDTSNGISWKGTQTIVNLAKGYKMQVGLNNGWNNLGVGYIASQLGDTWSILQIPHETGIQQIASRQWVNTMFEANSTETLLKNPDGTRKSWLNVKNDGRIGAYDYTNSRWAFVHNQNNLEIWGGVTNISEGAYIGYKSQRGDGTSVQWQTAPYSDNKYGTTSFAFCEQDKPSGATNVNQWRFNREGSVDVATRQWVNNLGLGGRTPYISDSTLLNLNTGSQFFYQGGGSDDKYFSGWGAGVSLQYNTDIACRLFIRGNSGVVTVNVRRFNGEMHWNDLWGSKNTTVDGNGFIKRASPIVTINNKGYTTNSESRGATVRKLSVGHYQICNILGYNEDAAWGVNGGISVPKDNNGLELVFVKDSVQADGSIVITTYHRQHAHLPKAFQNHRIKEVVNGKPVYMQDGEQCDLPPFTRLDIRVGMPEDCIYNVQQYWDSVYLIASEMHRTQMNTLSNKTLALPLL